MQNPFLIAQKVYKAYLSIFNMEFNEVKEFAKKLFNVEIDKLIAAIKLSPNAQGYLSGAITELELKEFLENKGYEALRIKEKWEGDKHDNHHGDFYVRKKGTKKWFVLESKGVKSNSEKWHKLFNKSNLIGFLNKHIGVTPFKDKKEIISYIEKNLPLFNTKYKEEIYTWNDVQKYTPSKRETNKSKVMEQLKKLSAEEIDRLVSERLNYVMQKIKVIETHFVSGGTGSKKSKRTQATPRIDEFHMLSLDLFLRVGGHFFIFVNPNDLEPSSSNKEHLQQNYVVDVLVEGFKRDIEKPWSSNFDSIFDSLKNPVNERDMQIDSRAESIEESIEKLKK